MCWDRQKDNRVADQSGRGGQHSFITKGQQQQQTGGTGAGVVAGRLMCAPRVANMCLHHHSHAAHPMHSAHQHRELTDQKLLLVEHNKKHGSIRVPQQKCDPELGHWARAREGCTLWVVCHAQFIHFRIYSQAHVAICLIRQGPIGERVKVLVF